MYRFATMEWRMTFMVKCYIWGFPFMYKCGDKYKSIPLNLCVCVIYIYIYI